MIGLGFFLVHGFADFHHLFVEDTAFTRLTQYLIMGLVKTPRAVAGHAGLSLRKSKWARLQIVPLTLQLLHLRIGGIPLTLQFLDLLDLL